MHDPMTVAFDIKYPWVKSRTTMKSGDVFVYRESFITIWHNDPERDGSDDSCGYTYPRLTKEQLKKLRNRAWFEARNPYFLRFDAQEPPRHMRAELEALYRGLILFVADALELPYTFERAARRAARYIHSPDSSDHADVFCYKHGYHDNFPDTDPNGDYARKLREDHFVGVMAGIARSLLRERRRWFQHPRWHIWHWRIQVHPWQLLRRWLFTRCGHCGKRFGWNESPVSYSWSGKGPCFHASCTADYEREKAAERLIQESVA